MKEIVKEDLLRNKRVVDEINRHLWIESEKVGRDIGFDTAATDWLKNFSKAWMNYYMPDMKLTERKRGNTTGKHSA